MNFFEKLKELKNIDKKIKNIVLNGIKFSLIFCLISSFILVTYITLGNTQAYDIGISIFKSGLFYFVGVIICGIAFNQIYREL